MYCQHCGMKIAGECQFCGSRLMQGRSIAANAGSFEFSSSKQPQTLRIIRGWLLFFCILTAVISPVVLFADNSADRLVFVRVIFGMVTGVLVWSVRPSAIYWLRSYFTIAIVTRLADLLVITHPSITESVWMDSYLRDVIGLLVSILWLVYFCVSGRVKLTLGRNLLEFS